MNNYQQTHPNPNLPSIKISTRSTATSKTIAVINMVQRRNHEARYKNPNPIKSTYHKNNNMNNLQQGLNTTNENKNKKLKKEILQIISYNASQLLPQMKLPQITPHINLPSLSTN